MHSYYGNRAAAGSEGGEGLSIHLLQASGGGGGLAGEWRGVSGVAG